MSKEKNLQLFIITLLIFSTFSISGCIDDPKRTDWAFENTQLDTMNLRGYRGNGTIIGIVDSGVNTNHPDLEQMKIIAWKDFIAEKQEPYDDRGHGSHVTGIIAANGELDGGAPEASFVIVKAMDSQGKGDDETVGNAIDFCVENGAHVICLSLGDNNPGFLNLGDQTAQAARNAANLGIVVVAAIGNDGEDADDKGAGTPANEPGVIAVGAIDKDLRIAPLSSRGDNDGFLPGPVDDRKDPNRKPEVVAPGVDILSTYRGDDYAHGSGTSAAAPFVVAGIALMLEEHPEYRRDGEIGGNFGAVEKIKDSIMKGAYVCPDQDTPHDDHYGYGLFRAAASSDKL